jgi:hypothetical protein
LEDKRQRAVNGCAVLNVFQATVTTNKAVCGKIRRAELAMAIP